jgi:hypothetical protein
MKYVCIDTTHNDFSENGGTFKTCMGYTIGYDAEGRVIRPDLNTARTLYICNVCGKTYMRIDKGWKREFFKHETSSKELFMTLDMTPLYVRVRET